MPPMTESDAPDPDGSALTRRRLLEGAVGAVGGAVLATLPLQSGAQGTNGAARGAGRVEGAGTTAVGTRSRHASPAGRAPVGVKTGSSLTPLQDLTGTITPSDLHFERHHSGVPDLDPARHTLLIHGLVERPLLFTVDDLRRFPQVSRIHFLECSGNGRGAWRAPNAEMTPQRVDGMTSNSEWTGVALATLLREVGARDDARWILAEGGDAALFARSIPIEKARGDAMIAWAQNGEPLRPEQGFPLRLFLPGYEGSANVKWLRRLELGAEPWMTRDETSKYTDPLKDGTARLFSLDMDAKSIITSPAHPGRLPAPGWYPVTGLAWSGRGRIRRVDVSMDDGATWREARLQDPVLPRAHTRFQFMWQWGGGAARLLSRAVDETGYVQPTRRQLVEARGPATDYHLNCIRGWRVEPDGRVFFHWES